MCVDLALSYVRRLLLATVCFAILPAKAADVKLAWDASPGPNVSSYTLKYGTSSGSYPDTRTVGNVLTGTISNLTAGVRYYVVVAAKDTAGSESLPSNEISVTPSGSTPPNQPPLLNTISNVILSEDGSSQVVNLSGISAGSGEVQTLTITASSSNPNVLPNPAVNYTSPNTTGTLTLAPVANANGTATVTVTVNDGQSQNNTSTRTFTVTVNAVNDTPTLNSLSNISLNTNAGPQVVALSGINSGAANESQTLTVTATHNNPSLLGTLNVSYSSPSTSGTLTFTPLSGATGTATITVRVQDDGSVNNFITRTFNVTVTAVASHTIFAEAESGTLVAPMTSLSTNGAFGGRYVTTTVAEQGTASYPVNIPAAGTYRIWCRILSPNTSTDSLYIRVDSGAEDVYDTADNLWSGNFQWTVVNGRTSGNPRLFNLSQGTHTIVVRGREVGTGLDALYVTDDASFVPPATPPPASNQAPTLNTIANLSIQEDAGMQTVNLSGIGSGAASEIQTLTVTATSSNPALIPTPSVVYTNPNSTGSLRLTPVANASGTANITVTVSDGQSQNGTVSRNFTVTVTGVNDAPVVNAGADLTVRLPSLLNLGGSVTDDGLPNPPGRWTASWSKVSGPGLVTFGLVTNLASSVSFTLAGQYTLRLTANDGALSSSDDVLVTVLPLIDVTGPVVSGLINDGTDARGFALRWQTDEPAVCQIEFGATSSLGSSTTMEPSYSLVHQRSVTNLLPGTTYYYRIRSVDQGGNSSVTPVATKVTPVVNIIAWRAEDGYLVAPMKLGSNQMAFQQTYVSSTNSNLGSVSFPIDVNVASNYRLWCRLWSPTAGSGTFLVSVDGGSEDTFDTAETGWKNGFRWVAVNGRGGGSPLTLNPRLFNLNVGSPEFLFRVGEPSTLLDELILSNDPSWVPDIHGGPPVLRATPAPPNRVDLSWTDNTADEQGFLIEVSTDGTTFVELGATWGNATNYQHNGVTPGTYYYRIYAFSDTDRTDYSAVVNTQLVGTAPAAPTGLTASTRPGDPVSLSWQDNAPNETGFSLERSADGVSFTPVQSLGANSTSTSDSPTPRDRYYYRVRAYNAYGSSPYSNVADVRTK